jgi:catechol 2,3-dioxygenase-like lactoylglutathione lyase family enzyme
MPRFGRLTPMLQSSDLSRTIGFYRETLGFELEGAWPEAAPEWCALRRGEARIMFITNDHCGEPSLSGTLYVEVDDALALHGALSGRVDVRWGPEVYPYGMLEFAIRDVDGYTISFGQPVNPSDQ